MPRPTLGDSQTVVLKLRIPAELKRALEQAGADIGKTPSEIIRALVLAFVQRD